MLHFTEYTPHLDNCSFQLAATSNTIYSFGSDDISFRLDTITKETASNSLHNPQREKITAIAVHPKNKDTFIIGTQNGFIRYLRPIHQHQLNKAEVLYKGNRAIKSLHFHSSAKVFGFCTDEETFMYSIKTKQLYSLSKNHQGGSIYICFSSKDFLFTLGQEGNLHLYHIETNNSAESDSQSQDPFANQQAFEFTFMDKYKIATETVIKKYRFINASQAHFERQPQRLILCAGQSYLQTIVLGNSHSNYKIQKDIHLQQEIKIVQTISSGQDNTLKIIATSSANLLALWNYHSKEKIFNLNTSQELNGQVSFIARIVDLEGPTLFMQSSGKLFYMHNHQFFKTPVLENQPASTINNKMPKQSMESRWEESKSSKLIPEYTQFLLEKKYEDYQGAKFLFYNNIGCVIERIQGDSVNLQLELHDKSRPKRLFLDAKNRPFCYFALRQEVFICATPALLIFQSERQLKQGFQSWQFRWENMQAITIGGNWIGLCSMDQIKILDYAGNELHNICFDRRLVTMEAYEDMLAVVYHGGLPMWGCQSLKVRIYHIGVDKVKLERDCLLPIKPNSILKWLGFSEEGMLYCQDSLQVLRGYIFEKDEWQVVHSLQNTTDRLFIQHISGLDIYGFKLQQKQGERIQPRVLPRSLPRKIPMDLPSLHISFLTKDQEAYFKKIKLRNIQFLHQEFRHNRWYKFKYSRSKSHIWSIYSKNICSAQQLKTSKALLDSQLIDYLKKFCSTQQNQGSKQYELAMRSLLLILQRSCHFEETIEAARKILQIGSKYQRSHVLQDSTVSYQRRGTACISKINQISILQKMVSVMQEG